MTTVGMASALHALAGQPGDRTVVLAPSAIGPAANIALLIEAGAQALLDHPDHVLLIFGAVRDPDYHAHCASLVREWSLRHRAIKGRLCLRDDLAWSDCLPWLNRAALVVCPSSDDETAGIVDASGAAGVPVLVRETPGNPARVTEGETGLLYSGLPDFVRQYRRLFADPGLREHLAETARRAGLHPPETPAG